MKFHGDTAKLRRHAKRDKRIDNGKAADRAARQKPHHCRKDDSRGKVVARGDVRYKKYFHLMFEAFISILRQTIIPAENAPIQLSRQLRLPDDIIVLLRERPG
jgi:hypothetical protein